MKTYFAGKKYSYLQAIVSVWIVALFGFSCQDPNASQTGKSRKNLAMPVTITSVAQKSVPLEVNTFGTVKSKASVAIKSQVNQLIRQVHFQSGQDISQGELLFTLESRSYEVALAHARSSLLRDEVTVKNSQREVQRNADLLAKHILSQDEYDTSKAAADALLETIKADQAAVEAAQLDLELCKIFSPITGRAGKILVDTGNLVKANDTTLVVINQIKPIDVFFTLPQAELDRIRAYQLQNELAVEAALPNNTDQPEKGRLTFIDNGIDPNSGTIELGASFLNTDERLWPGRYVLVRLILAMQQNAVVIPGNAIENGAAGKYVFVVKEDLTVEMRSVEVDRVQGDDVVIKAGLKSGERIVTNGQLRLTNGVKVEEHTVDTLAKPGKKQKG